MTKKKSQEIDYDIYCPICGRHITPLNIEEFKSGEHDGLMFVHDAKIHKDMDIEALNHGIN